MKPWRFAALPMALLATQAVSETWVTIATDEFGSETSVDKDSIRRGSDALVYFSDRDEMDGDGPVAIDCQRRVYYLLNDEDEGLVYSKWGQHTPSSEVKPGSIMELELKYVCANPPDSPFGSLRLNKSPQ